MTPLHAIFENVVDRTSLSTPWELNRLYGREINVNSNYPRSPPSILKDSKPNAWKTDGPRPRPLPPPPARPKYPHNIEGWWGWVAESDNEPESTVMELRTNAHKLLWEAIDYLVSVEADVFIPGFDRDGKGHPNFASLVMGHRLYQSASLKTYRPDRYRSFYIDVLTKRGLLSSSISPPPQVNSTMLLLMQKRSGSSLSRNQRPPISRKLYVAEINSSTSEKVCTQRPDGSIDKIKVIIFSISSSP